MRAFAKSIGFLSLAATIVPSALFMLKFMPIEQVRWFMLAGTVGWFATAPLWMNADES